MTRSRTWRDSRATTVSAEPISRKPSRKPTSKVNYLAKFTKSEWTRNIILVVTKRRNFGVCIVIALSSRVC